jgi:ribonuclease P protein subunit POP4
MCELLGLGQPAASMHPKLLKADFHGSLITVKQSRNISTVGLSGIVVRESENAFTVVTRKNQVKRRSIASQYIPLYSPVIPKQGTIFTFAVPAEPPSEQHTVLDRPHLEFELYGNQFRFRSADRAGRKFKAKETIEL